MIHRAQTGNTTSSPAPTASGVARTGVIGLVVLGSALAAIAGMSGCRGDRTDAPPRRFFPDMDYQPKLKAQSETSFFEDGHTQRLPVEGTVAFGSNPLIPDGDEPWVGSYAKDRDDMLKADETYYFGLVAGTANQATPQYVERMPVEVDQALITRGMDRFNIYCSMCHGYDAKGGESGTVGRLMNVRPINLLDDKYRDRSGAVGADGYIFHIIRTGLWSPDGTNRMPAYGHAVDEQDAWAIVSYVRTLQAAFDADGKPISQSEPIDQDRFDQDQGEQDVASTKANTSTHTGGEG